MFEAVSIFAQNKAFYCFVLNDIFNLEFVEFEAFREVKRPFITLNNEVSAEV